LYLATLITCVSACSAKEDLGVSADPSLGSPAGGATAGGAPGGSALPDAGPAQPTTPMAIPDSGGVTYLDAGFTGDKCVATKAVAPPASTPKIDIVWIVDSSQSMFDEQKRINMNLATFANAITMANLDVSIAMVSQAPSLTGQVGIPLPGICADFPPDPLAGNAFQMDPRYHFVQTYVDSRKPLSIAISAYPSYSMFLRPGSMVHFIIVTDDEDDYAGGSADGRAMRFQADMMQRLGRPFRVHTISSPGPTPCSSTNCEFDPNLGIACVFIALNCQAANSGLSYYSLARLTNGLTASICESDWSGIFKAFQESIIKSAPLPCDYSIPPPPKGEKLDAAKVNVAYTPVGGAEQQVLQVPGASACPPDATKAAWYYDNPAAPTKVNLCPATCTTVQAGGAMNIVYGCATVVLN
jgi:hypothetical protein